MRGSSGAQSSRRHSFFTNVRDCIKTERVTGGVDESGLEQGQRAMKIAPFAPTCINIDTKMERATGGEDERGVERRTEYDGRLAPLRAPAPP